MSSLPSGTVTFLFTDIEGSTRLWEREPQAMNALLARHDQLVRGAIEERGGHVFKTMGDAFCAAFANAASARQSWRRSGKSALMRFSISGKTCRNRASAPEW